MAIPFELGETDRELSRVSHEDGCTLAALVGAWNARGAPVPGAVVVSIFDDLLGQAEFEQAELRATTTQAEAPLDLSDVVIDRSGAARLSGPLASEFGDGVPIMPFLSLLIRSLQHSPRDESAIPPMARSMLARLKSDDPIDRPSDPEHLRQWIREALGSPAPHDEVLACVRALRIDQDPDPEDVDTLPPLEEVLPLAELEPDNAEPMAVDGIGTGDLPNDLDAPGQAMRVIEEVIERASLRPQAASALSSEECPSFTEELARDAPTFDTVAAPHEAAHKVPDQGADRTAAPELATILVAPSGVPKSVSEPVIRHGPSRQDRPMSVRVAPAARRSARPMPEEHGAIKLPTEGRPVLWTLFAVAVVTTVVLWVLRL